VHIFHKRYFGVFDKGGSSPYFPEDNGVSNANGESTGAGASGEQKAEEQGNEHHPL